MSDLFLGASHNLFWPLLEPNLSCRRDLRPLITKAIANEKGDLVMKKSITILGAVLLSASVYSQTQFAHPSAQNSLSGSGNPELDAQRSQSPERQREFEAQSGLRSSQDQSTSSSSSSSVSQGLTLSNDEAADVVRSTDDSNGNSEAKQGVTLSDDEAADVLRETDDPDMADRNNQQRANNGTANNEESEWAELDGFTSNPGLRGNNDREPDMIYEEWILITPPDVGAPAESETGSESSKSSDGQFNNNNNNDSTDPQAQYDNDVRNSGQLNDSRIYNGEEYSDDYVGAPAKSESGHDSSMKDDDDCDHDKDLQSSDEGEYHINRSKSDNTYHVNRSDSDDSSAQGSAAETETGRSSSSQSTSKTDRPAQPNDDSVQDNSDRDQSGRPNLTPDDSGSISTTPDL
jgi:hypothetical protein